MEPYYFNFLVSQLKKDIYKELSEKSTQKETIKYCIDQYFEHNTIEFREEKEPYHSHIFRKREPYQNKENKCIARIWNEGWGGQCSCKGHDTYNHYCKTHFKRGGEKGQWWLGTIHEVKPIRPVHPDGRIHTWKE